VRHHLLPLLAEEYPQFSVSSLCALNDSAREVADLIQRDLEREWPGLAEQSAPGLMVDADRLGSLPAALRKAALLRALRQAAAPEPPPGLRAEHLEGLDELARTHSVGRAVSLPRGFMARREHGGVYLGPDLTPERSGEELLLPLEGALSLPWAGPWTDGMRLTASVLAGESVGPEQARRRSAPYEVFLNLDAVQPPLKVRARRPGDVFHPLGAPGHRKLKDFLIDEQVPRHLRDRLPLVVDSAGCIVWVGGCRAAEPARVTGQEERVLHLRADPAENRKLR
jgi:tRNA(Ile)-lysidine synthase